MRGNDTIMSEHRYPYNWTLKDALFTKDKGTVFSCFACGGGSTMGYKLAGFDVIGCNEIDPKMMECYIANHNPKYSYLEPIQTFKLRDDLPDELYNLDILDGSPPCSSFSMAGSREDGWGKEKKFREGQAKQVLDTLFFDFIDLAKKLQPKVVIAENVKGLLLGNAKNYVIEIYRQFDLAGYYVQHFLLDASKMGVPQRRERVFFIAMRKDLAKPFLVQKDMFTIVPKLEMVFDERGIVAKELNFVFGDKLKGFALEEYKRFKSNKPLKYHQTSIVYKHHIFLTITSRYKQKACPLVSWSDNWLNSMDLCKVGTFPSDYNFCRSKADYLIGMSVPPVMTANIATEVYNQWLKHI